MEVPDSKIAKTDGLPVIKSGFQRRIKKLISLVIWIGLIYILSSLLFVTLYTFINPPVTPLMIKRTAVQMIHGKKTKLKKHWVSIGKISPNLIQAVIASEDNRFLEHTGFDFEAIQKAVEHNKRHRRIHGASTISQQMVKNVFLWPSRTYIRKAFEVYYTLLVETVWTKERIMEVYLNVIEMGDGIYGAEAAANIYFHKPASKLSREEAAYIAAILPNPLKRNPAAPTAYLQRRQARILNIMNKLGPVRYDVMPPDKRQWEWIWEKD